MNKLPVLIATLFMTILISCGGSSGDQPANAEGFSEIEKEIKQKQAKEEKTVRSSKIGVWGMFFYESDYFLVFSPKKIRTLSTSICTMSNSLLGIY